MAIASRIYILHLLHIYDRVYPTARNFIFAAPHIEVAMTIQCIVFAQLNSLMSDASTTNNNSTAAQCAIAILCVRRTMHAFQFKLSEKCAEHKNEVCKMCARFF